MVRCTCNMLLAGRAAVRADNRFEDLGAASLAPGLMGMAQLTSLNLNGTLQRIGWRFRYAACIAAPCTTRTRVGFVWCVRRRRLCAV